MRTSQHEFVLRAATWINEHLADGKSTMMLNVPEIGIDEPAEVISIWPCPPITLGEGRIVISTFTHVAPETICMYLDGLDEPIRCTPNHITWSVEAKDFVEAHELHPGNLVLCDDGPRKISRVEKIAEPIRVYNLEVQGQHVYQVSSLGMLVHNASPAPMGADGGGASSFANNYLQRLLGNLRGESNVVRALNRQVSRGLATADDIVALEQAAAQRAILTDRLSMMLAHPN
ncbi:MAG: hypothetical protein KDB05_10740 [Planctomycetales bacterium]|nr:hypothetical protein [Planctomycetales bacterium]